MLYTKVLECTQKLSATLSPQSPAISILVQSGEESWQVLEVYSYLWTINFIMPMTARTCNLDFSPSIEVVNTHKLLSYSGAITFYVKLQTGMV